MTARRPCSPAPGPLEDYAVQFDSWFHSLAQRHAFRTYLAGLLAPRDRAKTLTALAGAEPLIQAQAAPAALLEFLLADQVPKRVFVCSVFSNLPSWSIRFFVMRIDDIIVEHCPRRQEHSGNTTD